MIEGDHRVMGQEAANKRIDELASQSSGRSELLSNKGLQRRQGKNIDDEVVNLPPEVFGRPKAPAGTWASCIRIIDPVEVS